MKVRGEVFSSLEKKPKGQYMIYSHSQAKGLLLDRILESFLINTEGVIFYYTLMEKISQVKRQNIYQMMFIFCLFLL